MEKSRGYHYWLLLAAYFVFWPITLLVLTFKSFYRYLRKTYIILKTLPRDVSYLYTMSRFVSYLMYCQKKDLSVVTMYMQQLKKNPEKPCCYFEDQVWTFQDVEDYSNRIAHTFQHDGYKKGDVIALIMGNCPEFICTWLGLSKLGVTTALININLKGKSLAHCINISKSKAIIYSHEFSTALNDINDLLKTTLEKYQVGGTKVHDNKSEHYLNDLLAKASTTSPSVEIPKFKDPLLYIYTSGTTGLPKAALMNNARFLLFTYGTLVFLNLKKDDIFYTAIPLYHTAGGVLGVGAALVLGNPIVIRKKFSASAYFTDCAKYKCTVGQYIGEIGRYIISTPRKPEDKLHKIRKLIGVGMRPSVWSKLQERFGVVNIVEMYGATESNIIFGNLWGKVGPFGYIPRCIPAALYPLSIIKVNDDTGIPVRDQNGFCIRCDVGEPGMLTGEIIKTDPTRDYIGYIDKEATESKILYNIFKKGDKAFMSGDLVVMDEEGYVYFKDRTGDTFRWKGENISTSELETIISEILNQVCTAYGVQVGDIDGKAGMVAVVDPNSELDLKKLVKGIERNLPTYAQPYFIRIVNNLPLTATFKVQKLKLQKEGFDPEIIKDKIYFRENCNFVPLTPELYSRILSGKVRL